MKRVRKIITIFGLVLLLAVALVTAALATSVYANFGSGKSLGAKGPVIDNEELQSCHVVLIDLDRIEISRPSQLALLPNPLEKITITLSPVVTFNAGLLPRDSVDISILGFDTCIATIESNSWKVRHSALGQPWLPFGETIDFMVSETGTSISFEVAQVSNGTLIIATTDQQLPIQQIELNAELSYPNANTWAIGLVVAAGFLVVLFIALVVVFIIHSHRKPSS